jgi:hypothetical protein
VAGDKVVALVGKHFEEPGTGFRDLKGKIFAGLGPFVGQVGPESVRKYFGEENTSEFEKKIGAGKKKELK